MNRIRAVLVMPVFGLFLSNLAVAGEGVWQAADEFTQVNIMCTRVYSCVPEEKLWIAGDTRLAGDTQLVWGVCSAARGAVDSCNVCLTSAPKESCEWEVVKR